MSLRETFGLGERELVAFTGAGGKSTLLLGLGSELAEQGKRVVLTTTTKLGPDQLSGQVCWSADSAEVDLMLADPGSVFVVGRHEGHKVQGVSPEAVDTFFSETSADYVLVESDGARRRPLKAPADHEPVIPGAATLVVVVAGMNAVGQELGNAVHRPPQAMTLTGLGEGDRLRPQDIAAVLGHSEGGLKGIPDDARVVMALTRVDAATADAAAEIQRRLAENSRIERVVLVPS